jgi:hypothetical protein
MRIGGRKNYGAGETVVLVWDFLVLLLGSTVFGEPLQGAPGCWGFWARGPGFLSVSWG